MLHHDMWAIVRRSYSFHHTGHGISHFCFAQDKLSIIHHAVVGKLSLLKVVVTTANAELVQWRSEVSHFSFSVSWFGGLCAFHMTFQS